MASKPSIGGQALIEGVMMRGPRFWGLAVRKPDSSIATQVHDLPDHPQRHRWLKWPLFRGVYVLVESLSVGLKALRISANFQMEEEEQISDKALGWTMGVALIVFAGIFITIPALTSKLGSRWLGVESEVLQNLIEGGVRISFFVGYILLISLMKDIRRVFMYHGAEHKTIYAFENDDPMDPVVIDKYSTLHVRCGTNFLFIVLALTILVHLVMDLLLPESIPIRLGARVLAIPALAGLAYEVIKAAGKKEGSVVLRIVSLPGLALQKITTRPPTHDQIEVAVAAMEAVAARELAWDNPSGGPIPRSPDPSGGPIPRSPGGATPRSPKGIGGG